MDHTAIFCLIGLLTLVVGAVRNVPWSVGILWFVAVGVWAGLVVALGWALMLAALVAACLMPSRKRAA